MLQREAGGGEGRGGEGGEGRGGGEGGRDDINVLAEHSELEMSICQ